MCENIARLANVSSQDGNLGLQSQRILGLAVDLANFPTSDACPGLQCGNQVHYKELKEGSHEIMFISHES